MNNIFRDINKELTEEDILMLSPLQLAYIGDGVYEVFIRTYLLGRGNKVNDMNKRARKLVNANAQAVIVSKLEEFFTEKERKIIKRGRNTKVNSSPKNMDIMDYKYATGFEALIGYLYLKRENERLHEIMDKILYGKLIMKVQGCVAKEGKAAVEYIENGLKEFLDGENIKYENLSLVEIQEDEEMDEIQINIEFPMDCFIHEREEDVIYDKFVEYMTVNNFDFGGGAVLEIKEEADES